LGRLNGSKKWFSHHHHSRPTPYRRIVNAVMPISGSGARIVNPHIELTAGAGFAYERKTQWTFKVIRENAEHINAHN
jgi:uncharacterized membrane protein